MAISVSVLLLNIIYNSFFQAYSMNITPITEGNSGTYLLLYDMKSQQRTMFISCCEINDLIIVVINGIQCYSSDI